MQFVQIGRHTRIAILNKITDYMPNPTFERVAAPGAHEKFYSGQNPEGLSMREMSGRGIDTPPGARNPEDRIAELDRQGVDACLNYPTLANLVEHSSAEDPELTVAIIHALNQWMLEHWGFSHANRIYSTPVLNLGLVDEARRELEYILDNGAKVALIKPAPVNGLQGLAVPRTAGVRSVLARRRGGRTADRVARQPTSAAGVHRQVGAARQPAARSRCRRSSGRLSGHREIADMLTSLICHGTLTRFPKLRIASVENGSAWIKPLFDDLQSTYNKMPQNFPEHPHEVFRRNVLGQPVLGGLGGRRRADRRMGQGDVRLGLAASRRAWPSPRATGSTPRAWTSGAPTTSWATTPGASWGCRSPTPIRTPSSRRSSRTPNNNSAVGDWAVPVANW